MLDHCWVVMRSMGSKIGNYHPHFLEGHIVALLHQCTASELQAGLDHRDITLVLGTRNPLGWPTHFAIAISVQIDAQHLHLNAVPKSSECTSGWIELFAVP